MLTNEQFMCSEITHLRVLKFKFHASAVSEMFATKESINVNCKTISNARGKNAGECFEITNQHVKWLLSGSFEDFRIHKNRIKRFIKLSITINIIQWQQLKNMSHLPPAAHELKDRKKAPIDLPIN